MNLNHTHVTKILEWGTKLENGNVTYKGTLYGCTECDETSPVPFVSEEVSTGHSEHTDYVDGCFACKVRTLELNTGDAGRAESMSQKKWDSELNAYREARRQGVQPAGTTMKAVKEAMQASDNLGSAFNAETMGAADAVTKSKAKLMKETGVA